MNASQQMVVQYLNEARINEHALLRDLQSQIAVTPRGSYRSALETHLKQTRNHMARVGGRLDAIGEHSGQLTAILGFGKEVIGQAVALGKAPLGLLRGSGGEEKVLKNSKDVCANEAREIAMYTAIERLARAAGDNETAVMAASILADEEKMLKRVIREIPKLTDAVLDAGRKRKPSDDVTTTAASDAIREARADVASHASTAKRAARKARKVPGAARSEGQLKVAGAPEDDLAIARYDELTTDEIAGRQTSVSQTDRAKMPTGADVVPAISPGDDDRAQSSRSEESAESRAALIDAAQRELANSDR